MFLEFFLSPIKQKNNSIFLLNIKSLNPLLTISLRMKTKAILLGMITVMLLTSVTTVSATPNWNIAGTWNFDFNLGGSHYLHTMTITSFDPINGAFSGTGVYVPNPSYTWTVTGVVTGNTVDFTIVYDLSSPNPGYTVTGSGTISADGKTITGTANGPGQVFDFTATGTACDLRVDSDCDGVPNTQDFCPGTVADSSKTVPYLSLGTNRWVWYGTTSGWNTVKPKGTGPTFKPTMAYTYGCSCAQILNYLHANYPETYGNMLGQWKYGCSQSLLQDWHNGLYYIETVAVPASKDTETLSSIALQDGKNYVLKAYGTATACWETGCQITFDAEYSTSDGTNWVDGVAAPYVSYGPDLLDLMVNGGYVDWGTYNSAHTYWLPVVGAGTSLPFSLQVHDIYYPNNAGNINVDIYAKL